MQENKKYIETLKVCGILDNISDDSLHKLINTDINIKEYLKLLKECLKEGKVPIEDNLDMTACNELIKMLKLYKNYNGTDSKERFIYKIINASKWLQRITNENYYTSMIKLTLRGDLLYDLHVIDIIHLDKVKIKENVLYTKENDDGSVKFIDDKGRDCGGLILIKGDTIRNIKVSNMTDEISIVDKLLKDDYDLAITPSFEKVKWAVLDIYKASEMTNLEFTLFLMNINVMEVGISKEYKETITDVSYNIKDVIGAIMKLRGVDKYSLLSNIIYIFKNEKDYSKIREKKEKLVNLLNLMSKCMNFEDAYIFSKMVSDVLARDIDRLEELINNMNWLRLEYINYIQDIKSNIIYKVNKQQNNFKIRFNIDVIQNGIKIKEYSDKASFMIYKNGSIKVVENTTDNTYKKLAYELDHGLCEIVCL